MLPGCGTFGTSSDAADSEILGPGSLDRAHHHPRFTGYEPGHRVFEPSMSANPVDWVGARLAGLEALLAEAGVAPDPAYARDAEELRGCLVEIMDTTGRLLDRVRRGELAQAPGGPGGEPARVGWL